MFWLWLLVKTVFLAYQAMIVTPLEQYTHANASMVSILTHQQTARALHALWISTAMAMLLLPVSIAPTATIV